MYWNVFGSGGHSPPKVFARMGLFFSDTKKHPTLRARSCGVTVKNSFKVKSPTFRESFFENEWSCSKTHLRACFATWFWGTYAENLFWSRRICWINQHHLNERHNNGCAAKYLNENKLKQHVFHFEEFGGHRTRLVLYPNSWNLIIFCWYSAKTLSEALKSTLNSAPLVFSSHKMAYSPLQCVLTRSGNVQIKIWGLSLTSGIGCSGNPFCETVVG